jgi:hypothetical protein
MRTTRISQLLFMFLLLILLYNCSKNSDEDLSIHYNSHTYIRAYLDTEGRLTAAEYYNSQRNLTKKFSLIYSDNLITAVWDSTHFTKYTLNSNGLIECIIDSSNSVADSFYLATYNENQCLGSLFSVNFRRTLDYNYFKAPSGYSIGMIYFTVILYDTVNKVDIVVNPEELMFNLLHLGRQNQKLVKGIAWGANGGPSTTASSSHYSYKLDINGQVTEKTETYYPSHYYKVELKPNEIIHNLTSYEYIYTGNP